MEELKKLKKSDNELKKLEKAVSDLMDKLIAAQKKVKNATTNKPTRQKEADELDASKKEVLKDFLVNQNKRQTIVWSRKK